MGYDYDHDICSDCRDVKAYINAASKEILLKECHESCAAAGGSATPAFYFGPGGGINCAGYKPPLPCYINLSYENFRCNCKIPCPE